MFKVLVENGILPQKDLEKYENIASFRNILVHHYGRIDNSLVYGIFKTNLGDLEAYVGFILKWLENRDE